MYGGDVDATAGIGLMATAATVHMCPYDGCAYISVNQRDFWNQLTVEHLAAVTPPTTPTMPGSVHPPAAMLPRLKDNVSLGAFADWRKRWDAFAAAMNLTPEQAPNYLMDMIKDIMLSQVFANHPGGITTIPIADLLATIKRHAVMAVEPAICHWEANALCQHRGESTLQFAAYIIVYGCRAWTVSGQWSVVTIVCWQGMWRGMSMTTLGRR